MGGDKGGVGKGKRAKEIEDCGKERREEVRKKTKKVEQSENSPQENSDEGEDEETQSEEEAEEKSQSKDVGSCPNARSIKMNACLMIISMRNNLCVNYDDRIAQSVALLLTGVTC